MLLAAAVPLLRSDEETAQRMADLGFSRVPTQGVTPTNRVHYVRGLLGDQQVEFILRIDGGMTRLRPAYENWLRPAAEVFPEMARAPLPKGAHKLMVASTIRFGGAVLTDEPVALVDGDDRFFPSFEDLGAHALIQGNAVWMPASNEIYFRSVPLGKTGRATFESGLEQAGYKRAKFFWRPKSGANLSVDINGTPLILVPNGQLNFTVIESKVAKRLGLKRRDSTLLLKRIGEKRRKFMDISDPVELQIGDLVLKRQVAIAADLFEGLEKKAPEMPPLDGFVGMDLLLDLKAVMDWGTKQIWLKAPEER